MVDDEAVCGVVGVILVSVGRDDVEWMVRFDRLVLRNFILERGAGVGDWI